MLHTIKSSIVNYGQHNFKGLFLFYLFFFFPVRHPEGCKESSVLKRAVMEMYLTLPL